MTEKTQRGEVFREVFLVCKKILLAGLFSEKRCDGLKPTCKHKCDLNLVKSDLSCFTVGQMKEAGAAAVMFTVNASHTHTD